MYHARHPVKEVTFNPYQTTHQEDYPVKLRNSGCEERFVNKERSIDRMWAYTNPPVSLNRQSTSYTFDYGNGGRNYDYSKIKFIPPDVRPATTFIRRTERELEEAAQKVYRPTSEYRDQYIGARAALQPASFAGVQFSTRFNHADVPRDERSSQHRIHDHIPHVRNPYLSNPRGLRFENTKQDALTTGIVPSTLPKSASAAKVFYPTMNRLESTTYGATFSRPFNGTCVMAKPQNYSAPNFANPTVPKEYRIPHSPTHTDDYRNAYYSDDEELHLRPHSPTNNYSMPESYYMEMVPVPSITIESHFFIEPEPSPEPPLMVVAQPVPQPPTPPPPPSKPSTAPAGSKRQIAMPPAPRVSPVQPPSPKRPATSGVPKRSEYTAPSNKSNPYGDIPHVHVKVMPNPELDDPRFDMGDRPATPATYQNQYVWNGDNRRAANKGNDEDKFNLANIESILREADALSYNIRQDVGPDYA